jgi:hypothetical protein
MESLTNALFRERELLEVLLYKLETEQMVLSTGRTRWLGHAAREIEHVMEQLREISVLRSTAVADVAASLNLEADTSLRAIAEVSEDPWRLILLEYRDSFRSLCIEIAAASENNRELLVAGYQGVRDTINLLADTPQAGYGADGAATSGPSASRLIDRSI